MLAAERVVAAFWKEREVLGEYLASPLSVLAAEVRVRRLSFVKSLHQVDAQSAAETANIERALAANTAMIGAFDLLPKPAGDVRDPVSERLVHAAELAVLTPISRVTAGNGREYAAAEASAASAEGAGFHAALVASLLGLVVIAWFAIFAFRLVQRIARQNVELRLADVAKDKFIGTVSHEFRTPLTSMYGYVELLLDEAGDPLTQEQRSFLATVQRGAVRLEGLVNDLLLTAQLRAGQLEMQFAYADAGEIARLSVESAQAHAGHDLVQLNLSAPSKAIQIDADATRLAQVFDNLISNAIKFTPAGGRVDVALAQDDGRVTLTVSDTGMGMTADDIEHLFEPFFRTDSAKRIQGTGLGLPILKAIVEAHNGTIEITSEPNVGTSFAISLPLAQPLGRPATARQRPLVAA